MEHHSNIVPWQQLAERAGAEIDWAPIDDEGLLDMDAFAALLERGPKLVAVTHVSNVLGTENPLAEISRLAHDAGALVLADGAQAAPKLPLDVAELGVDFYAITGHKLYGPTGIGALWSRLELLREMPPFLGGGSMIRKVDREGTTYADVRRPASRPGRRRSRRRSGWPRRCAGSTGSGWRRCASTSAQIADYALERLRRGAGPARLRPARAARARSARSPSRSRASTPTTSPRSSTATASPSAPATTAPSC